MLALVCAAALGCFDAVKITAVLLVREVVKVLVLYCEAVLDVAGFAPPDGFELWRVGAGVRVPRSADSSYSRLLVRPLRRCRRAAAARNALVLW